MGTASAERPEGAGWVAWLAHRQRLLMGAMAVLLSMRAVGRLLGGEVDAALDWAGPVVIVAWLTVMPVTYRHFDRLCVECVASMPVDGQARAARFDRSLRMLHWLSAPGRILLCLGVMLLAQALVSWVAGRESVVSVLAGYLVSLVWFVGSDWLVVRHRPLVPWCPYCRWGRGGDDAPHECVPDPVPPSVVPDRVSS